MPEINNEGAYYVTLRGFSYIKNSDLIGKVKSPVALVSITLNEKPLMLDQQSLFWVTVPVLDDKNDISIRVTDSDKREVNLNFSLVKRKAQNDKNIYENQSIKKEFTQLNFGKYYALIIGNNDYQWYPKLKTAINDARQVEKILREK